MTIFGKILAIFVFLLSLVWFFLTVNLYATQANWKAAYDKVVEQAKRNADDTEELKRQLQLERAAVAAREQAVRHTVDDLAKQRDQIKQDYEKLQVAQVADANKIASLVPAGDVYDIRIKKLQDEVDGLTREYKTLSADRDLSVRLRQAAEGVAADKSRLVAGLEDAKERLATRITDLQESRTGAGGGSFRGEVLSLSEDGGTVSFSGGLNAGVAKTNVYRIVRDKAPYYIGTVTVTVVDTQSSAGVFSPAQGRRATGEYLPKPGDTVESR